MKYWRGYLTAAIFAALTWALAQLGQRYEVLVDMVYPYVTRSLQGFLTAWTAGYELCVWQIVVLVFAVAALAALVVMILCKKSVIQWLGWVLAAVSLATCLNTAVYGLNYYAGPIEQDLRLEMQAYNQQELEKAAAYYRDQANALAVQLPRNEQGEAQFPDFQELARNTGDGYKKLVREKSFSIFGGTYSPVKQLGWPDLYSSLGIAGQTCFLTGEAAVNPQLPGVALPFAMAKEMARQLCVARQEEAEFAAFLNCEISPSLEYRYSGAFMAYRSCVQTLQKIDPAAAGKIAGGCVNELKWDLDAYDRFLSSFGKGKHKKLGDSAAEAYLNALGGEEHMPEHGSLTDYLVNWFIQEYDTVEVVQQQFDPYDENQVDLSGLANAKPRPTEPVEEPHE